MKPSTVRILITDDHELVREGLKRILVDRGEISQIGEATNAREAIDLVRRETWSMVILDLTLPDRSGIDVLKEIKAINPSLPILVLSIIPEEQVAVRVLRAGADGFLSKSSAARDLVRATRTILDGGKHVSAAIAAKLIEEIRSPPNASPHELLSDREDQIFRRLAAGRTVGEIATELSLSVKTVSSYRTNALRKLGVRNNAQLMHYAYTRGLM